MLDERSNGSSRRAVIFRGMQAAGTAVGLGTVGPYVRGAAALVGDNDIYTLNFLLKFEYLQLKLYTGGIQRLDADRELKHLIAAIADQERRHIDALTEQIIELNGKPLPKRDYGYFGYRSWYIDTFLRLARELETNVVGAYNGAIPLIRSQDALNLAASIVQVDAGHAAAVAIRGNDEPAPEAFDPIRTEYQALNSVLRFVGSGVFE